MYSYVYIYMYISTQLREGEFVQVAYVGAQVRLLFILSFLSSVLLFRSFCLGVFLSFSLDDLLWCLFFPQVLSTSQERVFSATESRRFFLPSFSPGRLFGCLKKVDAFTLLPPLFR